MASRGPLPQREKRRTNKPTIPTTDLPAGGFAGPVPALPKGLRLGVKGKAWWEWAWRTPEAAAWSVGVVPAVARRAQLEDIRAVVDSLDLPEPPVEAAPITDWKRYARNLRATMQQLAGMAAGSLGIQREMRELEDRLGLNPKALAALRWRIIDDAVTESGGPADNDEFTQRREEREARLAAKA